MAWLVAQEAGRRKKIKDTEVWDRGMWMDYVFGQEVCRCPPESTYHERGTKQPSRKNDSPIDISQML